MRRRTTRSFRHDSSMNMHMHMEMEMYTRESSATPPPRSKNDSDFSVWIQMTAIRRCGSTRSGSPGIKRLHGLSSAAQSV